MDNFHLHLKNIQSRNRMLTPILVSLQSDLVDIFNNSVSEAGVIVPGYFSYFIPVLEKYRNGNFISKYHISEEEYSDSYTGKLLKIPVVDVYTDDNSYSTRIFVISDKSIKSFNS